MKTPIWPYIAVVACLFGLSLLAPHAWLRHGTQLSQAPQTAPRVSAPPMALRGELQTSVRQESKPQVDRQSELEWNSPRLSQSAAQPDVRSILQIEMPAQVAPIQAPVGEQIKLDVSVTETPALPAALATQEPELTPSPVTAPEPVAPLEKQGAETVPGVAGAVPFSYSLMEGLRELAAEPLCREWAEEIFALLEQVHQSTAFAGPDTTDQFKRLFKRLSETPRLANETKSDDVRAKLLRVGYAAKRRVDIWHQVHRILSQKNVPNSVPSADMQHRLRAVEERLAEAEHAGEWRRYLLLDEVRQATGPTDSDTRREVAKRVLKRIDSPQLSAAQVEIFERPPFVEFSLELRRWANEPVDYLRLLDQIEEYERSASNEGAASIASCHDVLRWSPQPEVRKLAELLNSHYRNANVRVAMTAEFLNRLLPDPQSYQSDVNENIAGANVSGTSHTINRLQVVLHPHNETWHIGLEAHGEVASDTAASKGPATFYNQGFARYYARKLLMVDRRGIRVWRAETDANSESELTGFETDFDPIPIVGWLARSVARSQHDQQYFSAKVETEEKVRNEAGWRFDNEVHEQLSAAELKVKQKLLGPFEKIDLKPTPLDMHTTDQRVIARYRLAGDNQLGAQTPRPQAPGDSLMSVQVHESALNNTLSNLKLDGRRTELHKLYRELADIFERPDLEIPDDIPEGVIIQFADEEAVRVRCDDSHVMLTIRIAELKSGRSKWNNFSVRAFYVPDSEQLTANLVREGTPQIIGERIGERLPLRVIFSKVLSKSRAFNLINQRLGENPHLKDCHVNQFVINDGWVGVGIGPASAGELDQFATKKAHAEKR